MAKDPFGPQLMTDRSFLESSPLACSCLAGPGVGEAVLAVHGWRDAVEVVEGHPLGVMTLLLECADR